MKPDPAEDALSRRRLDLVGWDIVDPAGRFVCSHVEPHPERYDIVLYRGERMLRDKLDDVLMPEEEVKRLIVEARKHPLTGQGPVIRDANAYAEIRRPIVLDRLKNDQAETHEFADKSEELLVGMPDGADAFAVLSIDVVGSTALSQAMGSSRYARLIAVLLGEIAHLVPLFRGYLLKFTGDGAVAYFPPKSFLTANDNAIDCALTARRVIRQAINPAAAQAGFPEIQIRIGLESGAAVAMTIGDPASKKHRDLIGEAVNMACKIQSLGEPWDVCVGQVAYQNLHTDWKLRCENFGPIAHWPYLLHDGTPYPVFRCVR